MVNGKKGEEAWLFENGSEGGIEMLCVEIDELTPCLTDNESGEIVETEVIRVKRKSFLSKYNKETGWYVKWSDLLEENEIYAIVVKV